MTPGDDSSGDRSPPLPAGLVVFHIDTPGSRFALLSYEVGECTQLPPLSDAERAVMIAVLRGRSNAQIAAARGTATRTVANQVRRLFEKLGVRSRAELAARLRLSG